MTDETTEQTTEPLTPAEVAAIQQLIADRQEEMAAQITAAIEAAVEPLRTQVAALTSQVATLQESVYVLDGAALKVGSKVALRASQGQLMCAENGGPSEEGEEFVLESRPTVGAWESYTLERGI